MLEVTFNYRLVELALLLDPSRQIVRCLVESNHSRDAVACLNYLYRRGYPEGIKP
jgi:hypothetical protein